MTSRDWQMALVISLAMVLLVAGAGYLFFWIPYQAANENIQKLANDAAVKQKQINAINKDRPKLERWKLLSLPGQVVTPIKSPGGVVIQETGNPHFNLESEYRNYLHQLLDKHRIFNHDYPSRGRDQPRQTGPQQQQQQGPPAFTTLTFEVSIKSTSLANLVAWMIDFQNTPLLQRIKRLKIKQMEADLLKVDMTIEALIVKGADKKRGKNLLGIDGRLARLNALASLLRPQASGLFLVPWSAGPTGPLAIPALKDKVPTRDYVDIVKKNIFVGLIPPAPGKFELVGPSAKQIPAWEFVGPKVPPPVAVVEPKAGPVKDVLRFAVVTDFTDDQTQIEATLHNRLTDKIIKLRDEKGYDTFPILMNGYDTRVVYGQLIQFDGTRGLIFRIQLATIDPSKNPKNHYPDTKSFYRLTKDDLDKLIQDKTIKPEQGERVFRAAKKYWDVLLRDKVMQKNEQADKPGLGKGPPSKSTAPYHFVAKHDLIRGEVIKTTSDYVLIRLDERYSSYRDDDKQVLVRPHLGFCKLTGNLTDALIRPLPEMEARKLLLAIANPMATEDPDGKTDP